jgi:hypothetical protein
LGVKRTLLYGGIGTTLELRRALHNSGSEREGRDG